MESTNLPFEKEAEQLKNVTSSTSAEQAGMRRDHESIDDFEHLDPESSPVTETPDKNNADALLKTKPVDNAGKEHASLASTAKPEDNQNSSEFSLLSDSKIDFTEANNTPELLEDISHSDSASKLIDFGTVPEHNESKLDFKIEAGGKKDLLADVEPLAVNSDTMFDLPTEKGSGLDLFNRFEASSKLTDSKSMSEAFMAMERGFPDGVNQTISSKIEPDIKPSQPKAAVTKPSTDGDRDNIAESVLNPSLAHIKDDMHDDDSFKDTDSIPEPTKFEDKFKDLPEDVQPSKSEIEFHDFNKDSDFHLADSHIDVTAKVSDKNVTGSGEPAGDVKVLGKPETLTSDIHPIKSESKIESSVTLPVVPVKDKPTISPKPSEPEIVSRPVSKKSLEDEPEVAPFSLGDIGLVVELVYWRDAKKSGIVFGSVLGILLSLTYFSLISVVAYLSLAILTGTISFRIYKTVLQAVQKTTSDGHPFKDILELDLALPQEKVREVTDVAVAHLNAAASELRRLFLVEDLVDSIKFGVLLWCLTYVGAWFNGMTLIIIAFVAMFTLPKVYETNKAQIDQNIDLVRSKIAEISSKIKATIRVGGKKAEEKKE